MCTSSNTKVSIQKLKETSNLLYLPEYKPHLQHSSSTCQTCPTMQITCSYDLLEQLILHVCLKLRGGCCTCKPVTCTFVLQTFGLLDKKQYFLLSFHPLFSLLSSPSFTQKYGLPLLWQLTDGSGRDSQMVPPPSTLRPPSAPHRWFSPPPVFQTRGPSLSPIPASSQDGVNAAHRQQSAATPAPTGLQPPR